MTSADSAVRFFVPESRQTARSLRGRLAQEIAARAAALAAGNAQDFADYRARVGEIRGLQAALDICDEFEQQGDH